MSYRKLKADYLFDGFKVHGPDTVLICRQDGMVEELINLDQAGGDIEHYSGLLSPGFINCHCHLELSHLRGQIPAQKGLVNFVLSVMDQRKKQEESIQDSIQEAESQMLLEGIVAVGDICNSVDSIKVKTKNRLDYYNFIELLGWLPSQATSRFNEGTKLASAFLDCLGDKNHLSLNPHAPYSISAELWEKLIPGFPGKTITIHNQESADENELFEAGSGGLFNLYARLKIKNDQFTAPGTHSLPFYLDKLKTASRILLVHNTYMDYSDLNRAASFHEGLFFCLCPNANYFIEKKLPDVDALVKKTGNIVLGTDSLASNTQLSILEEMKTIKKHFPSIPTTQLLTWATSNGSKALQFEEKLGDFTKLKKPGIVLVNHIVNGEIGENSFCRRIL